MLIVRDSKDADADSEDAESKDADGGCEGSDQEEKKLGEAMMLTLLLIA